METRIRKYETMIVLRPDLDKEITEAFNQRVVDLIKAEGGEVDKVNIWGKRRLAYEIDDYTEGIYVVINYTGGTAIGAELERVLRIIDGVLRYINIRVDDK